MRRVRILSSSDNIIAELQEIVRVKTGGKMDCIFLSCMPTCTCHAQLMRTNEVIAWYQPDENELKDFCHDMDKFNSCPRFKAFQNQRTNSEK